MRSNSVVFLLSLAGSLAACTPWPAVPVQAEPAPKVVDMHSSRNALSWAGVYEGVLPCADCPGIDTRLSLEADGGYVLRTRYLGREAAPEIVRGRFGWNDAGSAITLDDAGRRQRFRVGEGRLLQLDPDGVPLPADAPQGVLTKVQSP